MTSNFEGAHHFNLNGHFITAQNYIRQEFRSPVTNLLKDLEDRIAPGALNDSAERRDAPKCHPETRIAVQEEIYSWVVHGDTESQPRKMKWVTGPAGTGKTAIAGSLADRFSESGILAGCFFFWSSSPSAGQRTKAALVPTLAYQLAQKSDFLREAIAKCIELNPLVFTKTLSVQVETLILQPLRQVVPQANFPKVIVIDALDECQADHEYDPNARLQRKVDLEKLKDDDQLEILRALHQAVSDPAFPFRILITSRPERIIRAFFHLDDGSTSFSSTLVLDEKYSPDADIALFLDAKLADIGRKNKLGPTWPPKDAISKLVKNASGQFVYAATVIRFLVETQRAGNLHGLLNLALNLKPDDSIPVSNPFAHLDALYSQIIQSCPNPNLALLWIWIMYGELHGVDYPTIYQIRPSAHFVNQWLQTYPGESEYVLGDLHSLIKVPSSEDRTASYDFYHKSLFDFLGDPGRSRNLYVPPDVRCEFFSSKYFKVCLNQGIGLPDSAGPSPLFDLNTDYLDFGTNTVIYLTPSSVDWWVKECLLRRKEWLFRTMFRIVHNRCILYRCSRPCKLWRKSIVRICGAASTGVDAEYPFPLPVDQGIVKCARSVLQSQTVREVTHPMSRFVRKVWKRNPRYLT